MSKYVISFLFATSLIWCGCSENKDRQDKVADTKALESTSYSSTNSDATAIPLTKEQKESCKRALGTVPPLTVLLELLYEEGIIGLNYKPYPEDIPFMPNGVSDLPVLGVLAKGSLSFEEIAKYEPDIMFFPDTALESILKQYEKVGIEAISVPAFSYKDAILVIESYAKALGTNNGIDNVCGERVNKRAQALKESIQHNTNLLKDRSLKITKRPSVYFALGFDGLSTQCAKDDDEFDLAKEIGGINAIACSLLSQNTMFANIDFELLAKANPDVIFVREIPFFKTLKHNPPSDWANLKAIKNGNIFYAPSTPSNWLMRPPSVMQNLGFIWAFSKLQPELLQEAEAKDIAQRFFKTFLRELSDEDYMKLQGLD